MSSFRGQAEAARADQLRSFNEGSLRSRQLDAFLTWYYLEAKPPANKDGTVQTTKVELHQFLWDSDNKLTHIPTGATFSWKYPHSDLSDVIINWKNAADLLPTGERFDPCEIEAVARRIMRTYGPA